MANLTPSLTLDIEGAGREFFLTLKAVGNLKYDDYESITSEIGTAFRKVNKPIINVLIDGIDIQGVGLKAVFDDFHLGIKHNSALNKVAIYGNKKWQATVAKIGNRIICGEMVYFENATAAIEWLEQ
ncbi:STAS/SEC14 domain-containing protein [Pseudoalteromonas sp. CR1]|uniref:STAS/SEC14 domain-containing protein n=1 Tax=Pseudoalteromonas sp. CR1 TaxID=2861964 RepID=UPI001C5DC730|nr:STAS/SEC14 domain-containing protein [Pseudoalteromonas sp. CR1]MBW4965931.1 STAS/SEC14 domain-containing protein [Pseudoalteromonas sp. CR1]